jgi:hypothetical protein
MPAQLTYADHTTSTRSGRETPSHAMNDDRAKHLFSLEDVDRS